MLEKTGWREGEPLGPQIIHQKGRSIADEFRWENKHLPSRIKKEVKSEVERKEVEVIDLTLSDSDEGDPAGHEEGTVEDVAEEAEMDDTSLNHIPPSIPSGYERKALVTPLATVLKFDRLGIGLKPKFVGLGPNKAPQRRVTHNAAALALHIKAGEESRRQKKETGRGRRGFERTYRHEQEKRQLLWQYLNS